MKKKVTVYFSPIIFEVELENNLDEDEIEREINRQVYDIQADNLINATVIDYWE